MSILVIWLALFKEYSNWEKSFLTNIKQEDIVVLEDINLEKSVKTKLENFSKSKDKVDFVEITDKEFVYVFGQSLNTSLPFS